MRKRDKLKNYKQANLMLEQSYLKSKGLLKEEEEYTEGPHNYFPNDPKDVTKGDIKSLFNEKGIDNIDSANKFIQGKYGAKYEFFIANEFTAGYVVDFNGPEGKISAAYPVDINGSVAAQKTDDEYRSSEKKDAKQFGYKSPF